jgi:hypothetical protein
VIEIPDQVEAVATIREVIDARNCHALLPNGKEIWGFISKDVPNFQLNEGATVRVRMRVSDFSYGEMLSAV